MYALHSSGPLEQFNLFQLAEPALPNLESIETGGHGLWHLRPPLRALLPPEPGLRRPPRYLGRDAQGDAAQHVRARAGVGGGGKELVLQALCVVKEGRVGGWVGGMDG